MGDAEDRHGRRCGLDGLLDGTFEVPALPVGGLALREMHQLVIELEDAHEVQDAVRDLRGLQPTALAEAAAATPVAGAPRVVATEPPSARIDVDAFTLDLEPAGYLAVLVVAARVLADPAAGAEESGFLLVGGESPGEVQLEADTVVVVGQGGADSAQRLGDLVAIGADLPGAQIVVVAADFAGQARHVRLAVDGDHRVGVHHIAVGIAGHAGHHAHPPGGVEAVQHDALGPAQIALGDVVEGGRELMAEQFVLRGQHGGFLRNWARTCFKLANSNTP